MPYTHDENFEWVTTHYRHAFVLVVVTRREHPSAWQGPGDSIREAEERGLIAKDHKGYYTVTNEGQLLYDHLTTWLALTDQTIADLP